MPLLYKTCCGQHIHEWTQFADCAVNIYKSLEPPLAQLCHTLCDPTDRSPPGSSVHGILWARILEWVVIPFSRWSSQPRDQTQVSYIAGRLFTQPPGKPLSSLSLLISQVILPNLMALNTIHVQMMPRFKTPAQTPPLPSRSQPNSPSGPLKTQVRWSRPSAHTFLWLLLY